MQCIYKILVQLYVFIYFSVVYISLQDCIIYFSRSYLLMASFYLLSSLGEQSIAVADPSPSVLDR